MILANFWHYLHICQAEARAEFAERSVQKLQKEVDRLEGNIYNIQTILLFTFYLDSFYFCFSKHNS